VRIIVHDFAGHPFQVQLSRELAHRGHVVAHQYLDDDQSPKGTMVRLPDDAAGLSFEGLKLGGRLNKTNYVKRLQQDIAYGRTALAAAKAFRPDVYITANMPLDPLAILQSGLHGDGTHFVFWQQDFYSLALAKILPKKLPGIGSLIAGYYRHVERRVAREAQSIVCISDDFLTQLESWGVDPAKCVTIENWASLDEIKPVTRRPPPWQVEQGLADRRLVLYSGTLGLKHNPELLWQLARGLEREDTTRDVTLVVCSQGVGADWLGERLAAEPETPLRLLPFQPYERLSEVLGSASLVTALLEPDAGIFSVPSKVLSYMSAGRPVLLAAPTVNLAARMVRHQNAGVVVDPSDIDGFVAAALDLLAAPARLEAMGNHGRAYAERTFDISTIADRFEALWSVQPLGKAA
jgi:glycosyltransferase involved in cell wall biosynthesis